MQKRYDDFRESEGVDQQFVKDSEATIKLLFYGTVLVGLIIDILSYFNRRFAILLLPIELLNMSLFQFVPRSSNIQAELVLQYTSFFSYG